MGLGVLSDPYLGDNVPGTSPLDDLHSKRASNATSENSNLKRSKDGIVLVPQPSSSPDDPLNWPRWRKIMLMVTITYGSGIVGAFGPIIAAGLTKVAASLDTSVNSLSMMTGDSGLAFGLILILTAPASVIWGRRPVFLVGNALLLASSIWSAVAKDLGSLVASRVIGGAGRAPLGCLVEATIADLFFVHERGKWISMWSLAFQGGICGVSIVNGYLIQDVSWRACFIIEAVLCAILLILTIFFVPETAFVRDNTLVETSSSAAEDQKTNTDDKAASSTENDAEKASGVKVEVVPGESSRKYSSWRSLSPWTGRRYSDESFWKIFLRPFTLICGPVVAWGTLLYGTVDAWVIALTVSVSILFSSPAFGYGFSAGPVGLITGIGPLIGAILGNGLAGPLSDWSVTWLSRRNGGVYEPEFRLFMIIPVLITSTIGWFGWAVGGAEHELWIGPAIFNALLNFALAVNSIAVIAYVVDSYGHHAAEAFATIKWVFRLCPWLCRTPS